MERFINGYLDDISEITRRGDAREESYYAALKELVEEIAKFFGKSVHITILPKRTEAGNPDFRVWDGSHNVIGYIEAKTPGTDLDGVITTEQLKRYLKTFPNLILTDFYEFRLYRNGREIQRVLLARPFIPQKLKVKPPAEGVEGLKRLFHNFLDFAIPPISTAEALARELAHKTRFLRDEVIIPELENKESDIYGFYEAFKEYLLPNLTEKQFADLYAQTIAYGLFSARTKTENNFNRKVAYALIPSTIGILRDVFHYISLGRVSQQMEVMVDDIAALLNAVDVKAIMRQYQERGRGDEPIIHFYETFLAEYDRKTRESRGVYYTPQPVVSYIVRSVNILLKDRFGLSEGLADERVKLLDPAAGTLTFVAEAIRLAFKEFTEKYGEGVKEKLKRHILQNYYAFELLMAPYAIGHMKIGFLLESLGIPLKEGERFQLYLTNTLEMEELPESHFPGLASLSEESHKAARIKRNEPILVIMGNPPYSGISANINEWTERLLKTDIDGVQSYYKVDGKPLGEKNPKWLQDDYVKFLRFAQWKINKTGKGIVAMITNHSYIDSTTFRGMRQSLLKTFDEIYILDLHGNIRRETAQEDRLDENIFDIQQGVAIGIFVKHGKEELRGIYHLDLYGSREEKYKWLETHDITNAGYKPIKPVKPFYFFVPYSPKRDYQTWPSIPGIFSVNSTGIVTARDNFVIAFEKNELINCIRQFQNIEGLPDKIIAETYRLKDKSNWKLGEARKKIKLEKEPEKYIQKILYRPFDVRYIFYHPAVIEGYRYEVMRHMLAGENVGLVITRQVKSSETWQHCLVSNLIIESSLVSNKTSEIGYLFPLYLYPSDLVSKDKKPNITDWLFEKLKETYGFTPEPEEILAYIYAVLYSPTYRQNFADELKIDFPRIPFTKDAGVFKKMAELGKELVDLHLLRKIPDKPRVKYEGDGDDVVEFVKYDPENGRVFINENKYFVGITAEMWEYRIGGYQVLQKYLKDRKGRRLEDPIRYINIAKAISQTIEIQELLDEVYPQIEPSTL